jgi:serine phosphatase RsbU (regulator of sigma subunit)
VNAGHGDPLLVRSDGRLERLHPTGLPVGMLEEATYSAAEVVLLPGDKLVLFTDGLTEAENSEGQPFGEARVRELLRAHPAGSCQALCDTLEAAVTAFADGAVQKDDRTIMVVGYFPERD